MKTLKKFLENKLIFEKRLDEIDILCEKTHKPCHIKFYAYDKNSLDLLETKYKDHQYDDYGIFFATMNKQNKWIARTNTEYEMNPGRRFDKYIYC